MGALTVAELLKILQGVNPSRIVVAAIDPEGNAFNPITAVDVESSYYDGDCGPEKLTDELRDSGFGDEDIVQGISCIVLWP